MALWTQWGAPRPYQACKGSVPSPEQAPWHDVVVQLRNWGAGADPGSHEVCACVCSHERACERIFTRAKGNQDRGLWGLCKWPQMANSFIWLLEAGECWPASPVTRDLAIAPAGMGKGGLEEVAL